MTRPILERRLDKAYEKHRLEQARNWRRLSHSQRLRWLDQAKRFAARALKAAQGRKSDH